MVRLRGKGTALVARLALALISLAVALGAAEFALRYRRDRVRRSGWLDPGLFRYDRRLGWRLTPGWQGRHRHWDYDVKYAVNRDGLRANGTPANADATNVIAVVGDSFTFGFGVNDDETFIHRLDQRLGMDTHVMNFAVPGYSTDQEALLIEERVLPRAPTEILLVVYLGNDLFDNLRPFPLQGANAKPYFELRGGHPVLCNVPVPHEVRSAGRAQEELAAVVRGAGTPPSLRERLQSRSEVARRVLSNLPEPTIEPLVFAERFAPAVSLFGEILARIRRHCEGEEAELIVAALPGPSYVVRRRSQSAQYQDYLRQCVLDAAANQGLRALDLARPLGGESVGLRRRLFHPEDGHLTVTGHRKVADLLAKEILRPLKEDAPARGSRRERSGSEPCKAMLSRGRVDRRGL
jgi:hypothetical protein